MKKILFLAFSYPYGHFGPSDNCTVRVMDALARTGQYEVWNLSYKPLHEKSVPNYRIVDGVNLLFLPFSEKRAHHSYFIEHVLLFLKIPTYPIFSVTSILKHKRACKKLLARTDFDLVVSQCAPQDSVMAGAFLRHSRCINKHIVFFWDNIYGKIPRTVIPKWYALRRSRMVENWVAKYSDRLVSPIPVKRFHNQFGDVPESKGKRLYLGHPSIMRPKTIESTLTEQYIKKESINILYAGRLYCMDDITYAINLLNTTSCAERINLIFFFYQMPSNEEIISMKKNFRGSISISGKVPFDDLLGLYSKVDVFLGFAADSSAQVISKIYDYMCFGKPVVYFYKKKSDVNVSEFSKYPLFSAINVSIPTESNSFETLLLSKLGKYIDFEQVERIFPQATASAYVNEIVSMVKE